MRTHFGTRKGFTLLEFIIFMVIMALMAFIYIPQARAGGNSGVWPVPLVPDGTFTSGVEGGTSIFVIDFTAKNRYTGNVIGQFAGVTLSGSDTGITGTTLWPCAPETGISVYYADLLINPASGSSIFDLIDWTLLENTGDTLLTGNTVFAFDIPFNPAAPYGALKFVWSGASQFEYGFRYSTSGNP